MNEKKIYEGIIFDLVRKDVLINGKTYPRDIIRHPGGVGVLCVRDGKVLLVRQFRPAINEETLEIPAGKLEYGEDPMKCGLRELNEEAGMEADALKLIQILVSTPGFCDERIYIYEAVNPQTADHFLAQDEDEDVDSLWLSIEEAYEKVKSCQIKDAKTIIALQHAMLNR